MAVVTHLNVGEVSKMRKKKKKKKSVLVTLAHIAVTGWHLQPDSPLLMTFLLGKE